MKADEPGSVPRAQKYGMPIEEAPNIIRRHFGVLDDAAALAGAQVAHDIKISNALREATSGKPLYDAPKPSAQPLAEALGEAQEWRAKLGLG